jgi:hypothetical protein
MIIIDKLATTRALLYLIVIDMDELNENPIANMSKIIHSFPIKTIESDV